METKIRIFAILASLIMLTVIAMPMVVARRQDTRQDRVGILPIESPLVVEEIPMSIEIIENTRELTIVKVNDILITQKLDDSYLTKEKTKAVLTIEDLNSGEVEEIEIKTSYKAGEYTTTMFSDGVKLGTFSSAYDPLEPGVLRNAEHWNTKWRDDVASQQIQTQRRITRWWDGVLFVCGENIDIHYSRPCVIRYGICTFSRVRIHGTRMYHCQIDRHNSDLIVALPAVAAFAAIGAIIGTIIGGPKGTVIGAVIAAVGAFLSGYCLHVALRDERNNIWIFVHRTVRTIWVPILPPIRIDAPIFLRTGQHTLWDFCRHTRTTP